MTSATRSAAAILVAFTLARVVFALTLGLGVDEAYTLVVSRPLQLSYFDHPPLHQWIAHFSALVLGEGPLARLPFVAVFALSSWLLFVLTRRLYGADAGLIALVALNATPFFFASAGSWIVPDGVLICALLGAAIFTAKVALGDDGLGGEAQPSPLSDWLALGLCARPRRTVEIQRCARARWAPRPFCSRSREAAPPSQRQNPTSRRSSRLRW